MWRAPENLPRLPLCGEHCERWHTHNPLCELPASASKLPFHSKMQQTDATRRPLVWCSHNWRGGSSFFFVHSGSLLPFPVSLLLRVHVESWWGESKNQTVSLIFSSRIHYCLKELVEVSPCPILSLPTQTKINICRVFRFFGFRQIKQVLRSDCAPTSRGLR